MPSRNIFYSWQTDSDQGLNRYFIEDCLKRAITTLNRDDLSDLVIDRDTKNVAGMPDIGHTVLEKIAKSTVVVADLTLINPAAVRRPDERPVSNPNVLFELGYAFGTLGPKAMIGVFNTASGNVEDLPFDLRPKRLMTYRLAQGDDKAKVRSQLVDHLASAIKLSLGDTEEEKISRNSRVHDVLLQLRLFGTEIEEWYGIETLPNVILKQLAAVQDLPDIMAKSGSTVAVQSMAWKLIRDLNSAATLALNEENWPRIKQIITSSGEFAGMLLHLLGYKIDQEYHDRSLRSVVEMPSELDSHIVFLQLRKTDLVDLETLAHDLRMTAFLSLIPQHPQFATGLDEISLDFRRLVLRWVRETPRSDEAIHAVRDIRARLARLIDKYGGAGHSCC